MRINIGTKINLVFIIFFAELFMVMLLYLNIERQREFYRKEYQEEVRELNLVSRLQIAFNEAAGSIHNYIIFSGKTNEIENYEVSTIKIQGAIAALDAMELGKGQEQERFENVKKIYLQIKDIASKAFSISGFSGDKEFNRLMQELEKATDSVSSELNSFYQSAAEEKRQISAIQQDIGNRLKLVILLGILFNIVLIIAASIFFRKTVVFPLMTLKNTVMEAGRGNLDKRFNIRLNDEIGELGAAFNKMTQDLKIFQSQLVRSEKIELVTKLASGLSHEIKNTLSVIIQGMDHLSRSIDSRDQDYALTLRDMDAAVKRVDDIIRGLLDFSFAVALDSKPLNLNSVIEMSFLLVKHQMAKTNIKVTTEFQKNIPCINADRNKIMQVLVNLFVNAIESMPKGGQIKVTTYAMEQPKDEGAARKMVFVEIDDTGKGIPENILDRIFTPFFTTKSENGSTGLGLWVAKNIVDLHNGEIKIENKKDGKGVKVVLIFEA